MDDQRKELDERKGSILRALISHYVRSGEPVGSKTLVEKFRLGVSPATVRNEMAALEDAGFIYQPHTSAGRIPTDAGYRYFVDSWVRHAKLPERERARVHEFFGQPRWELQDSLRRTAELLSHLTKHAAIVFAPALDRSLVRKVELVRLSGDRAMAIIVTDTGRVENQVVLIPETVDDVQLDRAAEMLNKVIVGEGLEKVASRIRETLDRFPLELREAVSAVAKVLDDELELGQTDQVFLEGASNIVDEQQFPDLETVRRVIGALEHRRLLLEVLADAITTTSLSVRIGSENPAQEMHYCSVITAPYGIPDNALGSLAVVGPTRMDYRKSIAAVHEVAGALGRMLADLGV
ncbi:MAG: heat-inducible transcriptional repressor HrcA [Actinomycetota bacterium]|nr:heat-inducible transcriptional repressor HrcA [Actinomycetota bacterium]